MKDEDAQIFSDYLQEYWPSDELKPRQQSDESQLFYDFAKEHKLQQLVENYTRVHKTNRASILDYIFTNKPDLVPCVKVCCNAALGSDHALVYFKLKLHSQDASSSDTEERFPASGACATSTRT
jgi:hypothetical protein